MAKINLSTIDMTQGTPWKSILAFSIPMLIGNIAQQLYSTVDSIVVGQYVGDNALAAVGSSMPILNMLLVLFIGISAGATVMVSQYFGARQGQDLSGTIGTCITLTALCSLFLMLVTPPLIEPLLEMLNTPDTIKSDCAAYLTISMYGIAGVAYYNILGGILRGLGDAIYPLVFLIVATIVNIVLDVLFVTQFKLGVAGVAYATIIAQAISSVLCLIRLANMKDLFHLSLGNLKMKKIYVSKIVKLGLPSGLTQAIMSSAMIIVQSLTNSFGELFIAANIIIMRVDGFAMMPNFSFGTALTTYAGQNVGAQKYNRVTQGAKQGTLIAVICSTIITAAILIFGKYLMAIFTKTPELVDMSNYLMRYLAIGYIAMAVTQSLSGIMRGAGDTMTPMWISLITTVGIRIPLAYGISFLTRTEALPYGIKECIQISLVSTWVIGAILTAVFYAKGKWKKSII